MADNIDPQQIDQLNENLKSLIETMGGVAAKGPSVTKNLGEMAGLSKNASSVLGILGSSAASTASALYKGEKGAQVFSKSLESAADALTLLVLAIPGLGLAAKVAAVAVDLFAKGLNAASKQGDALYKTYQELQRSGATAADGITGVFNNMQNFGYGIEELDKMVRLVSENSQTLAQFSLTAADGTEAFSSAMRDITRDPALKILGKTPDDINAAGAAFIRQQVAMGRSQTDIGDKLGASTRQYVVDLDRLQRLTGTSADALQKQQDELLSEDAYNLYMENLEKQGAAGQDQANKIKSVLAEFPQYQKEIAAAIGGNVEAQGKLMFIAPSLIKNLRDPSVDFASTVKAAGKEMEQAKGGIGQLALYSDATKDVIGSIKDMNRGINSSRDIDKRISAADKNTRVQDGATQSLADLDLQNMNSRDALQSFVQLGVAPATRAMAGFARVASGVTGALPGAGPAGENSLAGKLDSMIKTKSGVVPTGAGGATPGKGAGTSANADTAMKFFLAAGYSKEQAAGIVGNLQTESGRNLDVNAVGDGGQARGIAQWHPDRQAAFAKMFGHDIKQSTLEEQLKFVDYELKNTEKSAGDKLKLAKSAAQAAQLVDKLYERSSGAALASRVANAVALAGPEGGATVAQAKPTGPLGSYQSQTAKVKPADTMVDNAKPKTAADLPTAGDKDHTDIFTAMLGHLENMSYHSQKTAENTHKTAKNTQG